MTTGYLFPLSLSSGNLRLASGAELIASQIRQILLIETFENPMRPEFGINHPLFESASFNQLAEYQNQIRSQLELEFGNACEFDIRTKLSPTEDGLEVSIFWSYLGEDQPPIYQSNINV